jgi:predicted transcriptional regulator
MNKAIIGISDWTTTRKGLLGLGSKLDSRERMPDADYHLNFSTPTQMFSELTPKRMELLCRLKQEGALSVYRLAKETGRNYSNVHADIIRLLELELVSKDEKGKVFVPWDDVEIHASLSSPAKLAA